MCLTVTYRRLGDLLSAAPRMAQWDLFQSRLADRGESRRLLLRQAAYISLRALGGIARTEILPGPLRARREAHTPRALFAQQSYWTKCRWFALLTAFRSGAVWIRPARGAVVTGGQWQDLLGAEARTPLPAKKARRRRGLPWPPTAKATEHAFEGGATIAPKMRKLVMCIFQAFSRKCCRSIFQALLELL